MHWTDPGCDSRCRGVRANGEQRSEPPCGLFAWSRDSIHHCRIRNRAFRGVSVPFPQLSSSHGTSDGSAARVDGGCRSDWDRQPDERVAAGNVSGSWKERVKKKARRLAGFRDSIAIDYLTLVQSEPGHSTYVIFPLGSFFQMYIT